MQREQAFMAVQNTAIGHPLKFAVEGFDISDSQTALQCPSHEEAAPVAVQSHLMTSTKL